MLKKQGKEQHMECLQSISSQQEIISAEMALLLDCRDEKLIYVLQDLHSSVFTLREEVKLLSKSVNSSVGASPERQPWDTAEGEQPSTHNVMLFGISQEIKRLTVWSSAQY
ncbi:hypothetical protein PCANC_25508 [Puccinia coronata f. sp. avenae]|uniref:Uncharacterized protein n=1 Tax=Puccinia coronata f. sp. avenae TaxID=200324 RepID=A0A2N5U9A8_9BASI|nr:hypothetical protein PCANC_25508 [Puccinia coronata f. sp. avenae]